MMMLHDMISCLVAALCVWAIVSPAVPTGVFGTLGLGLVACALLWSLDDNHDPFGAFDAMTIGVGFVLGCIALRVWRRQRKAADWQHTDVMLDEVGTSEHSHIAGGKR